MFTDGSYERHYEWAEQFGDPPKPSHRHHPSSESCQKAAAQGCWICTRLSKNANGEPQSYRLTRHELRDDFILEFEFEDAWTIEKTQSWTKLHSLAESSQSQTWTGDSKVTELAKAWLAQCQEYHSSCSDTIDSNWRPSRLLDVSKKLIRLLDCSKEQVMGPYAALSYCWGSDPFPVLSAKTMPQLIAGVPLSCFPTAFQQAFVTIQRLGIDYLWIDCYCIIQGSDNQAQVDWEYEADRMRQVYANANINIGNAHAASPNEWLFSTRKSKDLESITIRWRPELGSRKMQYQICTTADESRSQVLNQSFLRLQDSVLRKRRWVIQECVLSPRMLSFTDKEVFWQCSEAAACETFPVTEARGAYHLSKDVFWALTDLKVLLRANRASHSKERPRDLSHGGNHYYDSFKEKWFGILDDYCEASLTYLNKDVLRAIEGVGQRTASLTDDVYHHGVLQKTLPEALFWSARDPRCHRVPLQSVPTWHWAYYNGHVHFDEITSVYRHARLESYIASPLVHVSMSDTCRFFALDQAIDFWPLLLCIGRLIMVDVRRKHYASADPNSFYVRSSGVQVYPYMDNDVKLNSAHEDLALLPLIAVQKPSRCYGWSSKRPQWIYEIQGLVVRATRDDTFHRVGVFQDFGETIIAAMRRASARLIMLE